MAALPPSKRGLKNVKPDLMIDLSRKLEGNRYHPKTNPDGIIDIGSAYNELMLHDLEVWTRRNFHTKDVQSCKILTDRLAFRSTCTRNRHSNA